MPTFISVDDPADPRIDMYRDIRERDLVGRQGLFVAEGTVVLATLLRSSLYAPVSLLIAAKRIEPLAPLLSSVPEDVPIWVATQAILDAITGFPLHRGVLAIGRRIETPSADLLLRRAAEAEPRCDVLLLCGIANHDNLGGIFRNAAAFGCGAVLLDSECCDPLYRKSIRVSVGASLTVPFARITRHEDALTALASHGFNPVGLSPAGASPLADWRPQARNAVLLGAEGPGLPPSLMARMHTVRITMSAGFDSLNVATTSGIVLHHLASRRSDAPAF